MTTENLLSILCCPETYQALQQADSGLIDRLNLAAAAGKLRNRSGELIAQPLDGGFIRADGKVLYPIYGKLPVMLIYEAILLSDIPEPK